MKKLFLLLVMATFFVGCPPKVMYGDISVPEEGGIKFTQYTRDDEAVVGPWVGENPTTKQLAWYAPPFIGVSKDGKLLAYVARVNGNDNLYMKYLSGGRATIQRTFNRNVLDMAFSPNSKKLAFSEIKNGSNNIYLINALEGAAVQTIADSPVNEMGPSFARDGKTIFFTKAEGNRHYIWSINTQTSLLTQYGEGFTPVMTPDGKNIIVTRNSRDGARGEIWMINIRKGIETLILNDPQKGFSSPAISPDGKKIVCVGSTPETETRPQNLDLYSIKIDGTQLRQLTFHGGNDVSPQWGYRGKNIYFISQRGNATGRFNVWQMSANQN